MSDASPDVDELRTSILRVVDLNTGGPQPDTVAEHVVVENRTRRGTAPATVRDVLATLVEEGALERLDGDREPRYRRAES